MWPILIGRLTMRNERGMLDPNEVPFDDAFVAGMKSMMFELGKQRIPADFLGQYFRMIATFGGVPMRSLPSHVDFHLRC